MVIYFSKLSEVWTNKLEDSELHALASILVRRDALATALAAKPIQEGNTDASEDILCLVLSIITTISENDTGARRLASLNTTTSRSILTPVSHADIVELPVMCAQLYENYGSDVTAASQ